MLLIEKTSHDDLKVRFRNINRLTAEKASRLYEEIAGYIENPCRHLSIDLNGIHFIDARSFGILVKLHNVLEEKGIQLFLRNVSDEIWELIDLMQLTGTFHIDRIPVGYNGIIVQESFPLN